MTTTTALARPTPALCETLREEIINELFGGDTPATLATAIASIQQFSGDVPGNRNEQLAEVRGLAAIYGEDLELRTFFDESAEAFLAGRAIPEGWIRATVDVCVSELIGNDLEGVLDLLSERACDSALLMNIRYRVLGHTGDTLRMEVVGDATEVADDVRANAADHAPDWPGDGHTAEHHGVSLDCGRVVRFSLLQRDPPHAFENTREIVVHGDTAEFFHAVGGSDEAQGVWVTLDSRTADAEEARVGSRFDTSAAAIDRFAGHVIAQKPEGAFIATVRHEDGIHLEVEISDGTLAGTLATGTVNEDRAARVRARLTDQLRTRGMRVHDLRAQWALALPA